MILGGDGNAQRLLVNGSGDIMKLSFVLLKYQFASDVSPKNHSVNMKYTREMR